MTFAHVVCKHLNPLYHLIQIFPPIPHLLLPIYSPTHLTNRSHYSSLPSENLETVNKLVSIFSHQQPSSLVSTTELAAFGSKLTTDVVETTLKSFKSWETALRFFNWASTQTGYRHNCYTYNAMASILSGARQNAALKALYIDLVNSRCYVSPGALGFYVRCLGGLGMVNEANELFDQVKKLGCVPNDYSYNKLLEAIAKSGSVELMTVRMSEMRDNGWKPDKYTLTMVLQCYFMAGKYERALEVFQRIDELGWVDSYVFTIAVISLTKGGEVDKAIYLINKMDDFKISLNEKTFYVLIHGFVKEGKVEYSLSLLKKMQSLGFVPVISLYAVLIEGLCKRGEFTKALQLHSEMNEMGICPDLNLLQTLISSLADEREMICLLKEAKKHFNKKSMTTLHNAALSSLVKSGSIDKAYHLLRAMMKDDVGDDIKIDGCFGIQNFVPLDASSFGIVIDGLCQKGKLDVALELFNDMDQIGCKRSLLLYNNLIIALSDANKVEKCHELLKEMKANGFVPSQFTHNSIFGYYCRIGDVLGAINMVHEMHTHGHQPWIKHYTLLVKKLSTIGRVAEACSFLEMMIQEGFVPDMIAYSAAIDGWLRMGEVDYAWKMFKDISASGRCPDVVAYNTVINGLCKAKRLSEAQDVYDQMVQKRLIPSVVTYNLLIDAYCKNDDIDQAIGFFSMMAEKQRDPNVVTYTTLIDGLCNDGRSDEALLIWNKMVRQGKGCSPNKIAFMALIHGLCKCRKPDAALIYFEEMEEKHMQPDTYIYVTLIEAFLSVSNAPMALWILRKMIQNERVPNVLDKNCITLREAVRKLMDDALTSLEIETLIADNVLPIHLLQTGGP
ncbi:putative pentatricopeptide repeat-containing protein At5g08310, mitochondrial [Cynara cardunculus var. scolymus]|uniref:putative pentatricopeptide repeat-containing protein At5g08310, mitochondrial n=1 Tax=Cynara cardunculus var. scolymus TaxID=59895 RepID=UPI000D62982A|nr:putative pentatricopeptide repeat-containing protein At5g08310, mitochondrial [Cynara cardunculus var. scolymus]